MMKKTLSQLAFITLGSIAFAMGIYFSEKMLLIVAKYETKICDYIQNTLSSCATVIESMGSFNNRENRFIMVVLEPKKASLLKKNIKRIEENAFIVTMPDGANLNTLKALLFRRFSPYRSWWAPAHLRPLRQKWTEISKL